jgi:hypothetical protein
MGMAEAAICPSSTSASSTLIPGLPVAELRVQVEGTVSSSGQSGGRRALIASR